MHEINPSDTKILSPFVFFEFDKDNLGKIGLKLPRLPRKTWQIGKRQDFFTLKKCTHQGSLLKLNRLKRLKSLPKQI